MDIDSIYLYPNHDTSLSWKRLLAMLTVCQVQQKSEGMRRFVLFSQVILCLKADTKREG